MTPMPLSQPPLSGPLAVPATDRSGLGSSSQREMLSAGQFVAGEQLARFVYAGLCRRDGTLLVTAAGQRFAMQDGLRILGVEPGKTDPYGLTGRVDSLTSWLERGFVLSPGRVSLGRHSYDVEMGVILQPIAR